MRHRKVFSLAISTRSLLASQFEGWVVDKLVRKAYTYEPNV